MRWRLPLRFSLRALLAVMLLAAVLLGVGARIRSRGERQRLILKEATKAGGNVRYDFECYSESPYYAAQRWLAPRTGPDLVGNVMILNYHAATANHWRRSLDHGVKLHTIEYFSACAGGLRDQDLERLTQLRRLKQIQFQYCSQLPELTPLAQLDNLELLGLHSCRELTPAKLEPLRQLKKLKTLDLTCSDAGDPLVPLLASLPALEELHVEASSITSTGLLQLKSSRSLRTIYLNAAQNSPELAQQLPQFNWQVK